MMERRIIARKRVCRECGERFPLRVQYCPACGCRFPEHPERPDYEEGAA